MKRILAIAKLTWKAAFRYRLIQVLTVLLLGAVVLLPLIIKHDGTAEGFTQILLTYTLSAITALLGFATLWLGCGTMARDVEDCQIQMVAVKPISRWQIWAGKWLGIMAVNLLLLSLAGGAVYGLLQYRSAQLPPEQQNKLKNVVLVARGSAKEEIPDIEPAVEKIFQERIKESNVAAMDHNFVRSQIREQLKARFQLIPSASYRPWKIDLGIARHWLKDQPIYIRTKFNGSEKSPSGTFSTLWQVGPPGTRKVWQKEMKLAPESFHEFEIPPNLFDEKGILTIIVANPNNAALLFAPEDSMEVLYREGGIGMNYVRALLLMLSWMALLAALGLAAASFLSFPVAAFFSLAVLFIGLSSGTISQVVEEGGISGVDHETGRIEQTKLVDRVALPFFRGLLRVVKLFEEFSPVDSLSTGRSVSWAQLGMAWVQIAGILGGCFAAAGILVFNRRELATAQHSQ